MFLFSQLHGLYLITIMHPLYGECIIEMTGIKDYLPICFATSAAKSSSFFCRPSPVSKRMNAVTQALAPAFFAVSAM